MNAGYCTWFRYPSAWMSLPQTEAARIGDSIYLGRKSASRQYFSWESDLHSQIWAAAIKFIQLEILHTGEPFSTIITCLQEDLGLHNHLLHQTYPVTDNFWLTVLGRHIFQTWSVCCILANSKVARTKTPLKTVVSLWMYCHSRAFMYKKYIYFFLW